jgi:hypothetical protein
VEAGEAARRGAVRLEIKIEIEIEALHREPSCPSAVNSGFGPRKAL